MCVGAAPTNVADSRAKLLLHCHDLVHDLMCLQVPSKAALACCTEGAAHGTPHLQVMYPPDDLAISCSMLENYSTIKT